MTVSSLAAAPFQIQLMTAQVWRENVWVTLPIQNATGVYQAGSAGTLTFVMSLDTNDPRVILYEGERIRFYGGIYGAPMVRRFTGFVDAVQTTDNVQGTVRSVTCSDNFKELKDALLLEPRVYDGIEPNQAIADAVNQAITSGQLNLYDDNGNLLNNVFNYDQPDGNGILDAPRIFNDDLSTYYLPQGPLGSTNTLQSASQTMTIPPPSGTNNYIELQIPYPYIIASTMSANLTLVSGSNALPPASGTYYLDSYNGIAYMNPADQGGTFQFACFYYSTPLFGFQLGTSVGDVISNIMDKTGQHLNVDPEGKFHVVSATQPRVPSRILGKDEYVQNGIQTNRDRRNVIVCEGWDGNCGGVLAAKAVLLEDTILQPPLGLGKRSYLIVQDPTWKTQYAVTMAALYAAQQIGRKGKIMTITIIDDPSLQLDDVIGFLGTIPELANGDFFIIDQINYQVGIFNGTQYSQAILSGNLIPGQQTVYIGPGSAMAASGNIDYTVDVQPIFNCSLSPPGGTTAANFSIAEGLNLIYTIGANNIYETINIWGSDGSHTIAESQISRSADQIVSLPLPSDAFTAGVLYVIQIWAIDTNGNVGVYRDCIYALP